jgi:hypothetical protein
MVSGVWPSENGTEHYPEALQLEQIQDKTGTLIFSMKASFLYGNESIATDVHNLG